MLNPGESCLDVTRVPRPVAAGHAWMVVLRLPAGDARGRPSYRSTSALTVKSGVFRPDVRLYDEAPCGPTANYSFIPGTMKFATRVIPPSVAFLVSTWESVVNGRSNWASRKNGPTSTGRAAKTATAGA